jgi:hypothetical protein
VIGAAASQRIPVELTRDPRFERRIRRLTVVSAVALGLIWVMAVATLEAPLAVDSVLAAGWLLMPSTLVASLLSPRLRYGLVVPASLVSVGLLAVCLGWLPADPVVALGWLLVTAGVALGGGLGLWFWYRPLPVPARLDDPFSTGRWGLIGVHVTLVVTGFVLAARALWE